MDVVTVTDLHKHYGDVRAVDGVSFAVRAGEVFALLGPNGAGKTTLVEILEGHRRRTSGHVDVLGFDPETGGGTFANASESSCRRPVSRSTSPSGSSSATTGPCIRAGWVWTTSWSWWA
nr:ATP-binding cassette domain-containing protein [Rhodococcus ruber]